MTTIKRWTDKYDKEWVCGASDHGAFCRLCQPVDEKMSAILDGLDSDLFALDVNQDGTFNVTLTERGFDKMIADWVFSKASKK